MRTGQDFIKEAEAFGREINAGRESYTGPDLVFHHLGHKRHAAFPWLGDKVIGGMVRMLNRDDVGHEVIVCAARDRIYHLSEEKARLLEALNACAACVDAAEGEGLTEALAECSALAADNPAVERLIDLVNRRLVWARTYANAATGAA